MRTLTYYVAAGIDGFIAAPDGRADFFPVAADMMEHLNARMPETVPTAYRPHAGLDGAANLRFDTVLMGRRTYEAGLDDGVASPWRHLRQYVVSSTLTEIAEPEVTPAGDPTALVRRLKGKDGLGIWLSGGGKLAASLLPEIDELIVKRYPVVIGAGIPLFAGDFHPHSFALTETRTFSNDATVCTYARH